MKAFKAKEIADAALAAKAEKFDKDVADALANCLATIGRHAEAGNYSVRVSIEGDGVISAVGHLLVELGYRLNWNNDGTAVTINWD